MATPLSQPTGASKASNEFSNIATGFHWHHTRPLPLFGSNHDPMSMRSFKLLILHHQVFRRSSKIASRRHLLRGCHICQCLYKFAEASTNASPHSGMNHLAAQRQG